MTAIARTVVVAESPADVVAAVHHARRTARRLTVRPVGGPLGPGVDDAVVVDLSRLAGVDVDGDTGVATVAGGATWATVLATARPHGLAPVPGPDLRGGVVDTLRDGGLGWLARAHGMSRDALRAAEVVTPDGAVVRTSATEQPDLLWALRGGGPVGVGVVTAVVLDLVPVTEVYAGDLRYPAAMAPEVTARYAEWSAALPAAMTSALVLVGSAADGAHGPAAIVRGCFAGPVEQGRALVDSWRRWAEPVADRFAPMALVDVGVLDDEPDPAVVTATEWLRGLPDEVVDVLRAAVFPTPGVALGTGPRRIEIRHVAGALGGDGPVLAGVSDLVLHAESTGGGGLARLRRALAVTGATTGGALDAASLARLRSLAAALDPEGLMGDGDAPAR